MRRNVSAEKSYAVSVISVIILLVVSISGCSKCDFNSSAASDKQPPWDLDLLYKPPPMKWLDQESPVYALEYQGLPYKGKPTTVFAYYATPGSISGRPELDVKLPGIILIHGGMTHALPPWVEKWAQRGYAAVSMDLRGCGSDGKPLLNAVPSRDYLDFDFNYHMVANVILAHSLLLSFKEVDADRTAVVGYSVGGQLTCLVASLDERFTVAVSIYGCGYLHESSLFSERLSQMKKVKRDKWIKFFDPSSYIGSVVIPILFVTGASDPFYPLDKFVKTYELHEGSHNFLIVPGLPHKDLIAIGLTTPYLFIDQFCRNGIPIPSIEHPEIMNGEVQAKIQCETKPFQAFLYYTTDMGEYKERKWNMVDASIEDSIITCPCPPENTTAWLLTLTDDRSAIVSSEVIFP